MPPAGYRSFLGFWIGGVSQPPYTPPTPTSTPWKVRKRKTDKTNKVKERLQRDDDEIIFLRK